MLAPKIMATILGGLFFGGSLIIIMTESSLKVVAIAEILLLLGFMGIFAPWPRFILLESTTFRDKSLLIAEVIAIGVWLMALGIGFLLRFLLS